MNGKQARNLRKIIREDVGEYPLVRYEEKNVHTKHIFTGNTNLDGTPQFIPIQCSTRELVGCQRKAYQVAKKLHFLYHSKN